jgi:hypothetical protein
MQLRRFAAAFALLGVFSLAACGGGSSTAPFFANATGQQSQVRFVNGDPKAGVLDMYVFASASSQGQSAAVTNLSYAQATDFTAQSSVSNTVTARVAGSGPSGSVVTSCNLPPLTNNTQYSVVIADKNGTPNCMLFQDANYGASAQYRFHFAAADAVAANAALGTVAYGVGTTSATFTAQGTASLGGFVGGTVPTVVGTTGNQAATTGAVFAMGTNASAGASATPLVTLQTASIFTPGAFTQPDAAGTLPFSTYAGTSLYAIDCTSVSIAAIGGATGIACTNGIALIGVFDTK